MMDRRGFLKLSGAATVTAALPGYLTAAAASAAEPDTGAPLSKTRVLRSVHTDGTVNVLNGQICGFEAYKQVQPFPELSSAVTARVTHTGMLPAAGLGGFWFTSQQDGRRSFNSFYGLSNDQSVSVEPLGDGVSVSTFTGVGGVPRTSEWLPEKVRGDAVVVDGNVLWRVWFETEDNEKVRSS